jgi:hypothetical protein
LIKADAQATKQVSESETEPVAKEPEIKKAEIKKSANDINKITDALNQLGAGLNEKDKSDIKQAGAFLEALGGMMNGTPKEQTKEQKEALIAKKKRQDIENQKVDQTK